MNPIPAVQGDLHFSLTGTTGLDSLAVRFAPRLSRRWIARRLLRHLGSQAANRRVTFSVGTDPRVWEAREGRAVPFK